MTTGIFKAVQRRIQAPSTARGEIAHAVAKADVRGCVTSRGQRQISRNLMLMISHFRVGRKR